MNGSEDKLSSDPFTFASKEHIFFAHRAPWGEIKQSRAQIEALAEICVIGVTFPVRTIKVHNGYMFLAARGDPVSILCPYVAHRSCPWEAQRSDPTHLNTEVVGWQEEKQIVKLSAPDFE